MRRIFTGLVVFFSTLVFIPTIPAHAAGPVTTAMTQIDLCHGNNCQLGRVVVQTAIRQWREDNGDVNGTEAFCQILKFNGVTRVQVDRCALGIDGGSTLWADTGVVNSGTTDGAYNMTPFPPSYVSTIHNPPFVTQSDWDIVAAGTYSIRWADGQLSTGHYIRSGTSFDYWCYPSGGSTYPCSVWTLP